MGQIIPFRTDNERVDDLQRDGMRILQKPSGFRFGTDSVLLADFATIRPRDHVVDLGTGTGVLPLLLAARCHSAVFEAIEIQLDMADMASRSVQMNGLSDRITVHGADLRSAAAILGYGVADLVVCNPPYGKQGGTLLNPDLLRALARHEQECTVAHVATSAGQLLRNGGKLAMVFPASRLLELMDAMRAAGIEPKRVRMIHSHENEAPKLALVEGIRQAKPGLHWMPPLVLFLTDGSYSEETRRIYGEQS